MRVSDERLGEIIDGRKPTGPELNAIARELVEARAEIASANHIFDLLSPWLRALSEMMKYGDMQASKNIAVIADAISRRRKDTP